MNVTQRKSNVVEMNAVETSMHTRTRTNRPDIKIAEGCEVFFFFLQYLSGALRSNQGAGTVFRCLQRLNAGTPNEAKPANLKFQGFATQEKELWAGFGLAPLIGRIGRAARRRRTTVMSPKAE